MGIKKTIPEGGFSKCCKNARSSSLFHCLCKLPWMLQNQSLVELFGDFEVLQQSQRKRVDILNVWFSREPISGLGITQRALNYLAVLMDLGMGHLPKLIQWGFQTCRVRQPRSGGRMLRKAAETFTIIKKSALMNSFCYFQNQLSWVRSKVT